MSRSTRAKWWHVAGWSALALLVSTELVILGHGVIAAPLLVLLLLIAYLCSPLYPRTCSGHWAAQQRHVRHATAVVYWRPGCMFCGRLRFALWRTGLGSSHVDWVDIWDDPEAAAYVRDLNEGSETVPTVILPDGSAHTNPDPAQVVTALTTAASGPEQVRPQQNSLPPQADRPRRNRGRPGRRRPGSGVSRGSRGGTGAG